MPAPRAQVVDLAPVSATPLFKWVGGKRRMLPHVESHYTDQSKIVEPFFGGGAVSFKLASEHPSLRVLANEKLTSVVDIYTAVRDDVEEFITSVEAYSGPYLELGTKDERKTFYYDLRQRYMEGTVDGPAPLFFMLWCGFQGLYRTGKKYPGRFSTPFGFGSERPDFFKADNLRAAAALMSEWEFTSGDFYDTLDQVDQDTFVFLDPPYRTTFTGYTADSFTDEDQKRVVEYAHEAAAAGAKVVYTNKHTEDSWYADNFSSDFSIDLAPIRYQVNRNCAEVGRPMTYEVVVHN